MAAQIQPSGIHLVAPGDKAILDANGIHGEPANVTKAVKVKTPKQPKADTIVVFNPSKVLAFARAADNDKKAKEQEALRQVAPFIVNINTFLGGIIASVAPDAREALLARGIRWDIPKSCRKAHIEAIVGAYSKQGFVVIHETEESGHEGNPALLFRVAPKPAVEPAAKRERKAKQSQNVGNPLS